MRVIHVAPGHYVTPELRSDDNIIYTKVYNLAHFFPSALATGSTAGLPVVVTPSLTSCLWIKKRGLIESENIMFILTNLQEIN